MAEQQNILTRLGNLFQSNIIIKKNDDGGVVVKDINMMQRGLVSNFIEVFQAEYLTRSYTDREALALSFVPDQPDLGLYSSS